MKRAFSFFIFFCLGDRTATYEKPDPRLLRFDRGDRPAMQAHRFQTDLLTKAKDASVESTPLSTDLQKAEITGLTQKMDQNRRFSKSIPV